jgi:hypothetical protein
MTTFSLDYDGTYTSDPELWLDWVQKAQSRGHRVICVTMRHDTSLGDDVFDPRLKALVEVVPTGHKAKKKFMRMKGINIDIWIDDQPDFLYEDARL